VNTDVEERLVKSMAEQLKAPLLQISLSAELSLLDGANNSYADIKNISDMALRMLDGFLLGFDMHGEETFKLEPVSLASVLNDTAHILEPVAKRNQCDISIDVKGKHSPAMANRERLGTALTLIGNSLMEGRVHGENHQHRLVLGLHKASSGLVAGVFDNQPGFSSDVLKRGRAIFGLARQTLPSVSAGNGAGVYVADRLFNTMDAPLRVARHSRMSGLAATFHPSRQLRLV